VDPEESNDYNYKTTKVIKVNRNAAQRIKEN
jgi:hypothetical protein